MMQAGAVTLQVPRWTPYVETFRFKGIDLTGAALHAQVRLRADTPGDPLINLVNVTTAVQGLRLVSVDTTGVVPVSTVEIRIDATTLADAAHAPAAAEIGADVALAWDLHVTPSGGDRQCWLAGPFVILAGVTRP